MSHRILLIDDEDDILEFIRYNLTKAGYEVYTARNGAEGLQQAAAHRPHLILLDMMMPVMDGLSATRAIRGMDRPDAQLPIIAMTANLFDEDVAACLAAGMDAHIPKPLEAGQMIRTIAEWLERKKQ